MNPLLVGIADGKSPGHEIEHLFQSLDRYGTRAMRRFA
jgi:hypothetical protein